MRNEGALKSQVRDFWNKRSCGEVYAFGKEEKDYYESHSRERYTLEPYIHGFARFSQGRGKDVLEIGVGMGADHIQWARSEPQSLTGIDFTPRAVEHTIKRLAVYSLKSNVFVGDAEELAFDDESFDLIYSWGVLHHSPNTAKAVDQIYRVLRPNGIARIMIYHRYSLIGYMLWARYGLLTGHVFRSLDYIYANYLESPGTKAYSVREAREMFEKFSHAWFRSQLGCGDLLQGAVGQRHDSLLLTMAKSLWPRWLLKRILKGHGLGLLIEARK